MLMPFIILLCTFFSSTDSHIQMHMEKLRLNFRNWSTSEITCSQCTSWVSWTRLYIYFYLMLNMRDLFTGCYNKSIILRLHKTHKVLNCISYRRWLSVSTSLKDELSSIIHPNSNNHNNYYNSSFFIPTINLINVL